MAKQIYIYFAMLCIGISTSPLYSSHSEQSDADTLAARHEHTSRSDAPHTYRGWLGVITRTAAPPISSALAYTAWTACEPHHDTPSYPLVYDLARHTLFSLLGICTTKIVNKAIEYTAEHVDASDGAFLKGFDSKIADALSLVSPLFGCKYYGSLGYTSPQLTSEWRCLQWSKQCLFKWLTLTMSWKAYEAIAEYSHFAKYACISQRSGL